MVRSDAERCPWDCFYDRPVQMALQFLRGVTGKRLTTRPSIDEFPEASRG
jgi:hypothetical protein